MSFETAYVQAYGELSRAQEFHNRNTSKRNLSYNDMKPETFKSSFFHSRISESLRSYIKVLYDASLYGNNIIDGFMTNVQHALGNCCVVQKSEYDIQRVYICDLKKTKTMIVPSDTSEYIVLNDFVTAVIMDTQLLSFSSIKHGKRIKQKTHYTNDTLQATLRKAITDGNETVIGKFAGTLIWILSTKQMSVVQNASMLGTGMSYCNGLTNESRLIRTNPVKKAVITQRNAEEATPELEERKPEKIENENVPDSWEDLEM